MALESATPVGPTQVNPFNGVSNESATADKFQSLWDAGAFATPEETQAQQKPPLTPDSEDSGESSTATQSTESAESSPPEPSYASIDDYLGKAQIERDSFYSLPVTVKVDGQTRQVPLSDVLRSYQLDAHVTQKSQALADRQREWEAQQTQAQSAWKQRLETAEAVTKLAHQQLTAEFQAVDWNALYRDDPARFAAEQMRFQQRVGQIQQAAAQIQQQQHQMQQEAQQKLAASIPQEREKLLQAVPAWRDSKVFEADKAEMLSAARQMGFTDAELSQVYDHRYLQVLHYASQFLKLQAASPQKLKQVRAAPQIASQPGARVARDPKAANVKSTQEALRKNPKSQDAQVRAFEALLAAGV